VPPVGNGDPGTLTTPAEVEDANSNDSTTIAADQSRLHALIPDRLTPNIELSAPPG
jgi:hypothetical protein